MLLRTFMSEFLWTYIFNLCVWLSDPMNGCLPGSSVHEILQGRILDWVAIPFSRGFPNPEIELRSPALHCRQILYYLSHQGNPMHIHSSDITGSYSNSVEKLPNLPIVAVHFTFPPVYEDFTFSHTYRHYQHLLFYFFQLNNIFWY